MPTEYLMDKDSMKEKIKALWELCFDDSKEFVEMYFRLRYKKETNVAIESGDEVISALQMIPYPMTFCKNMVHTSYISGACTHPDFRGKGVMRELLSQTFTKMFHNGIHFGTLIPAEPWLFDYYARMGFASVFHYSTKEITVPEVIPANKIAVTPITECREDIYHYLNKKLAERPCCIQHTFEDFQVIIADLSLSDGILFVARKEDKIDGIAILYKEDKQVIINELLAETKDAEDSLLHHIKQYSGDRHIIQLLPPHNEQTRYPLGMARIINVKEVLQLYAVAFPEDNMQLELSDKQLSVNNGYYYLHKGKCTYSTERLPGAHLQMNISELTNRILQPFNPYMSLMLN